MLMMLLLPGSSGERAGFADQRRRRQRRRGRCRVLRERSLFDVLPPKAGRPVQTGLLQRRLRRRRRRGHGRGRRQVLLGLAAAARQRRVPVQRPDHVVRADQLLDRGDFRLFGHGAQVGLARDRRMLLVRAARGRRRRRRAVPAARVEVERRRHAGAASATDSGRRRRPTGRRGRRRRGRGATPRGRGRPVVAAAAAAGCGLLVVVAVAAAAADAERGQRRRAAARFRGAERAQRTLARVVTAGRQARVARHGRRHVHAAVAAATARRLVHVQVQRDSRRRRRRLSTGVLFGAGSRLAAVHCHGECRHLCTMVRSKRVKKKKNIKINYITNLSGQTQSHHCHAKDRRRYTYIYVMLYT